MRISVPRLSSMLSDEMPAPFEPPSVAIEEKINPAAVNINKASKTLKFKVSKSPPQDQ